MGATAGNMQDQYPPVSLSLKSRAVTTKYLRTTHCDLAYGISCILLYSRTGLDYLLESGSQRWGARAAKRVALQMDAMLCVLTNNLEEAMRCGLRTPIPVRDRVSDALWGAHQSNNRSVQIIYVCIDSA
jgi:hypothetical protein